MNAAQQQNLVGITGITRRLVMDGVLTAEAARKAQDDAASARKPIATFLLNNRLASTAQIAAANAMEFGMPLLDLGAMAGAPEVLKLVSEELIQKHKILPLMKRGNRLFVAISDPVDQAGLNEIKFQVGLSIEPVMVDPAQLLRTYEIWQAASSNDIDAMLGGDDEFGELEVADDIDDAGGEKGIDAKGDDDTPIVKFVNKSLVDAIRRGASDIHFEPYEDTYRVRYRIDGVLRTVSKISHKLHSRIAARLKVMSQLDIAEKRIPQDGRIKLNLSKTKQMDFRVSTLPTLFGEKIVLRLLDGGAAKMGIEKLGYEPDQQQLFMDAIHKPYGMVLVTGPTGSGKTVSLYTALGILNDDSRNISTVEDPVEIRLPGVNQVQQNNKTGMTFAAALRSFLRQDPDIIMVGEIRDLETAEIAVKAAQTGHMVLSTLHTNDGPQTISRLMNMGIAPYNITSSVTLVIAQRLARRLCPACKKEVHVPENALLAEGFTEKDLAEGFKVYEAVGCSECSNGYKGRTGIYQVMPMTEEIQAIVLEGGNAMQIAEAAQRSGVRDLRQSALLKVKQGVTSLAEINRVTKD
ncbi:type IV-A pilus assembly ATPase PilB [Lysobacteraceae bacterium NML75-0749]|nr:type IV-A pilus assembly ATPase PilB [Xanthomonadaceae bacterium NML75-0749]PJK00285.1 type IV-A pilus assembly ATPase PilB [Xanthomonadaceae bacterium NML03-0222]PJK05791.1 type IV-A pilus assembly ATPase PilB [Xanthomonadaceae bacterium NML91-0268]PJK06565.1 type IV-A pilus assembly ATPase PilB [Xanthomonadaceae bacterium NML71-0210]